MSDNESHNHSSVSELKGWGIVSLGIIFYCYQFLLRSLPSVIASDLMSYFDIGMGAFGAIMGSYYYVYTPMQLPVGILMDRVKIRILLPLACLCCVLGSILFMITPNVYLMTFGRLLTGFGSAFAFVGSLKLAATLLPANRFGLASGLTMTLAMIGAVVGNSVLTFIVDQYGWRNVFAYGFISGGVLLSILLFLLVRDPAPTKGAKESGEASDWGTFFRSIAQLIRSAAIWKVGIMGFFVYTSLAGFSVLWGPIYLERAFNFSHAQAAQVTSMVFLGWAVGSPLISWFADYCQRRVIFVTIGAFCAAVCIGVVVFVPGISPLVAAIMLFGYGFFSGIEMIAFSLSKEYNPPYLAGTAVALTNLITMITGIIFQPLIGVWIDQLTSSGMSDPHAFKIVFSIFPLSMVIAAIMGFFLKETYGKQLVK